MTAGRVTVDGLRNSPVHPDDVAAMLRPILDVVGVDVGEVAWVRIDHNAIRVRVKVRNRRGRTLPDSHATITTRISEDIAPTIEEPQ